MNIWHDIDPALITPERFMAVIEIKRGGKNKYELDKATGMLRLDRVLYTSTHYPANPVSCLTFLPSFKSIRVGIDMIENSLEVSGFSSVLSLPTVINLPTSESSSSMTGA